MKLIVKALENDVRMTPRTMRTVIPARRPRDVRDVRETSEIRPCVATKERSLPVVTDLRDPARYVLTL